MRPPFKSTLKYLLYPMPVIYFIMVITMCVFNCWVGFVSPHWVITAASLFFTTPFLCIAIYYSYLWWRDDILPNIPPDALSENYYDIVKYDNDMVGKNNIFVVEIDKDYCAVLHDLRQPKGRQIVVSSSIDEVIAHIMEARWRE